MLPFGSYFVDFAAVAGGNKQISGVVEGKIPDVFGAGIEEDGGTPVGIDLPFGAVGHGRLRVVVPGAGARSLVLDLVNLAVGSGAGIDGSILVDYQRLYLQLHRFEDGGGLPVGRDAIHA